jgi:hypothetical protein
LTISWFLDYSINHAKFDHSIGQFNFCHSIDSIDMPVITRSKAKLLEVSNEFSEVFLGTSSRPVTDISSPPCSTLKQSTCPSILRSFCHQGTSFDQGDDYSISNVNHFQISKFQTSENTTSRTVSSDHNLEILHNFLMESDCEDSSSPKMISLGHDDILKMLSIISSQMTSNYQDLQECLNQTDLQLSTELRQAHQDNNDFRQNVSTKMDTLWNLITQKTSFPSLQSNDVITPVSSPSPVLSSSSSSPAPIPLSTGVGTLSEDFQVQMMKLLNETFSKLSTAIGDNKSMDVKTDWPKFSGDSKKFRAWHLAIMAQLSLSPWQELYDSASNDIVQTTSNTTLNGKLYAKLLVSLEGQALQNIVSRKHLRANGVLLL